MLRRRCLDPKHDAYPDYGGRGITVCDSWKNSFANFLADMGRRPVGMMLDRTDNNKGYSKENCRWVTRTEQNRNSRKSRRWHIKGKEYPSSYAAAEALGVSQSAIVLWVKTRSDCSKERLY